MSKQKVIAVVGPTASGKSSLGIWLAQKLGGEIISADSRQVYKGLDIGTGKVTKKEMRGVPHHLLDVASPKKQFTVDDFVRLATQAHSNILQNYGITFVVGGTGLYVDMFLGRMGYANVPPNPALRARLEKKSLAQLLAQLKKLDPARAKTVEPHHKRRIIRAIEIAKGQSKGKNSEGGSRGATAPGRRKIHQQGIFRPPEGLLSKADILWLGLNPPQEKLHKNIRARLQSRMKAGMIAEARRLHKSGLSYKRMEELGLEYRWLARLLKKQVSPAQFEAGLERDIRNYAKRQMRWFKRNKDIRWVSSKTEALCLAKAFLSR